MTYALECGDVAEVLRGFKDASFDALMCDPPYGFSFMGKAWDYDVPSVETWRECLRVLKPGAPLVAFGGSRTYHRIACRVEDAGFELRDCLMWLYGKGFPKSLDVSKAIDKDAGHWRGRAGAVASANGAMGGPNYERTPKGDPVTAAAAAWSGYGTALKPAWEPIVLARKPLVGTMVENVTRYGVGGLAIDACRIEASGRPLLQSGTGTAAGMFAGNGSKAVGTTDQGRWPANLILDEQVAALLDAEAGDRPSTPYPEHAAPGAVLPLNRRTAGGYADSGGPSRFFYCSKVSTKEREAGCEGLALRSAGEVTDREDGSAGLDNPRAGAGRTSGARNHHPTLKPLSLTTWLAKLIMPPTAAPVLLVPFAGAGSEMIGAVRAGWPYVLGIEREAEYIEIARARLKHWCPERQVA